MIWYDEDEARKAIYEAGLTIIQGPCGGLQQLG